MDMESLMVLFHSQAACVAVLFISSFILWQYLVFLGKMRGPFDLWRLAGTLTSFFLNMNDIYDWITQIIQHYGGSLKLKSHWLVFSFVTTDPKHIEYIVKTKFSSFPKGGYFKSVFVELMGDGILTADGEEWVSVRKLMSSVFHSPAFKRKLTDTMNVLANSRLVAVLEHASRSASALDIQDLVIRLAFDGICSVVFGMDAGCLSPGLPDVEVERAFHEAIEATAYRFITPRPLWKAMRFLGIGIEGKLKASVRTINNFVEQAILQRRKELANGMSCERVDLLSIAMQMRFKDDGRGVSLSDKEVRDMCMNFVLAGRDTASAALSWFFWLLIQHPHVEDKIFLEIQRILDRSRPGDNPKKDFLNDNITAEDIKEMQYLHAALSETLRLYPSIPLNFKEVAEDGLVLPGGRRLKKGTIVLKAIYSMGRMEKIWGKDCMEFRPERWLKDGVFAPEDSYKYPVFNAGPRVCLGKDFAYLQMKWVAASLLYRYRLRLVDEHVVAVPKLGPSLFIKNGLRVTVHPRSEE